MYGIVNGAFLNHSTSRNDRMFDDIKKAAPKNRFKWFIYAQ
jgi:hypothetical protein